MAIIKGWKKIKGFKTNMPTVVGYASDKGGVIWILDLKKERWYLDDKKYQFGGVDGRGYRKKVNFSTKDEALDYIMKYMRSHPNG